MTDLPEGTYGLFPYHGFTDWEDVRNNFGPRPDYYENKSTKQNPVPEAVDVVLIAIYSQESYEGSAAVLYFHDGKYWFNQGSHCSCHGLEDQWGPEAYETADLLKACIARGWGILKTYREQLIQAIDANELRLKGAFN